MLNRQLTEGIIGDLGSISNDRQARLVAVLSAAIAVSDNDFTERVIRVLKKSGIDQSVIYETVLQSYLFLGFPRMIEASLVYNKVYGDIEGYENVGEITESEAKNWHDDGIKLCRVVYGKNFERLKKRFLAVSPEMFRWMVLEGYGKVLSRSGMNQIERELAEVAALIVDKRERQLVSHVLGSLNVGASISIIKEVNADIRRIAGEDAYKMAVGIIAGIEEKL